MKFIESIRLEDGKLFHIDRHQRRVDLTLLAHFGGLTKINLAAVLAQQNLPAAGLFKIRVTYGREVVAVDIDRYERKAVERVELVDAPRIDYRYKYADRAALDALREGLTVGTEPIIVQSGVVTDAIYANVCFFDGSRWVTPERPLLHGVAREVAIAAGEIFPAQILATDVRDVKYSKVRLINCMNWFAEAQDVPCKPAPRMA